MTHKVSLLCWLSAGLYVEYEDDAAPLDPHNTLALACQWVAPLQCSAGSRSTHTQLQIESDSLAG